MPPSESQPESPPLPRPCPDSQPVPACPALPHSHQSAGGQRKRRGLPRAHLSFPPVYVHCDRHRHRQDRRKRRPSSPRDGTAKFPSNHCRRQRLAAEQRIRRRDVQPSPCCLPESLTWSRHTPSLRQTPTARITRASCLLLLGAITGREWFYYIAISSILLVLIFSANTAFADFPRVCHFIAEDGYRPHRLPTGVVVWFTPKASWCWPSSREPS